MEKQGKTDATMKFTKGVVDVKQLTNFYIVGSLAEKSECYLTGHGGSFDSQYFLDSKTFTVPKGVTINFYQPDGYILGYGSMGLRSGAPTRSMAAPATSFISAAWSARTIS